MAGARAKNFAIYGEPLLALVAYVTLTPSLVNAFREPQSDFTVFLTSALAWRQHIDPYRQAVAHYAPNANPPATLLPLAVLTWLPERVAFSIWTGCGLIALVFSLRTVARASGLKFRPLLLAAIGLQGVGATLKLGQVSLLLFPLITQAWLADRTGRKTAAGTWLGVLVYLKPFVGLYAVYMLWRREWNIVRSLVLTFLASVALGLMAGPALTMSWIETLRSMTAMAPHAVNASWLAIVWRVFMVDRVTTSHYTPWVVAPQLAVVLWLAGAGLIGLGSWWAIRRTTNRDHHWAIVGIAMLLLSPVGWMYYTPLLIPPLVAVVPRSRHLILICLAAALLWVPTSVLSRGVYGALATATIGSPYTWGLLLLWATICADARESMARLKE